MYELVARGLEEVIVCRDCGCRSTDDIAGANAFTHVIRGGGCIRVCRKCADLAKYSQAGLMAVLIKETQEAARAAAEASRRLELVPDYQSFRVQACPARAPSASELFAHEQLVRRYIAEHGLS